MNAAEAGSEKAVVVEVIQSKEEVIAFAQELLNDIQVDYLAELRAEARCPVCTSIEATPYDSQGQRAGEPFTAVTKDVSACGISFTHNTAILERYLLLRFPRSNQFKSRWIVLEVIRRRQVGPLWEIAGRFIAEPKQFKSNVSSPEDPAGDHG